MKTIKTYTKKMISKLMSLVRKEPVTKKGFYDQLKDIDDILGIDMVLPKTSGPGYVSFDCRCGLGIKIKVEDIKNPPNWTCTRCNSQSYVHMSDRYTV